MGYIKSFGNPCRVGSRVYIIAFSGGALKVEGKGYSRVKRGLKVTGEGYSHFENPVGW